MSHPVTPARARRARDPRSQDLMVRYSKIPHTPYGIRNSEIRNANAVAPDDGAGSSGPIGWGHGAVGWSGFRSPVSSPANPAYRPSTLPAPSDALATPSRSITGHPHLASQSPTSTHPPGGS